MQMAELAKTGQPMNFSKILKALFVTWLLGFAFLAFVQCMISESMQPEPEPETKPLFQQENHQTGVLVNDWI